MQNEKLRVTALAVQNVKKIRAFEIDIGADQEMVIITGDNAQGKSSVFDAFLSAITGEKLADPIRHGAKKATIKLDIAGETRSFSIQKTFTASGGSSLKIVDDEGKQVPQMQTFLNSLYAKLALDPIEFSSMKPKDQAEALRKATGLDLTAIDSARAKAYDARTVANKRAKDATTLADNAPKPAEGTPEEELSASDLLATIRELDAKEAEAEKSMARIRELANQQNRASDMVRDRIAERDILIEKLARAEQALAEAISAEDLAKEQTEAAKAESDAIAANLPDEEQLQAAQNALTNLEATNREVRKRSERRRLRTEAQKLQEEADALDDKIKRLDEMRKDKIANTKLPVEGIEIEDAQVLYKGCVFQQLSTAEQIKISTMVAMAQNPSLRVILIREGALINRENKALIASMAKEAGYQVWMEVFQEDPSDTGIHIEDGSITHIDGKEVARAPAPEPVLLRKEANFEDDELPL